LDQEKKTSESMWWSWVFNENRTQQEPNQRPLTLSEEPEKASPKPGSEPESPKPGSETESPAKPGSETESPAKPGQEPESPKPGPEPESPTKPEPEKKGFRTSIPHTPEECLPNLPRLPFDYDKNKVWILWGKHPSFPFASPITDLDYQLFQYFRAQAEQSPLYYGDDPFVEICNKCLFEDDPDTIRGFLSLVQKASKPDQGILYDGICGSGQELVSVLEELTGIRSRPKKASVVLANATKHFTAVYASLSRDSVPFFLVPNQ